MEAAFRRPRYFYAASLFSDSPVAVCKCLLCGFYSSVQDFAFRFRLTTGTLAVQLMVPTTKPIAGFHRRVTNHARRTRKGPVCRI